jgi:tRNA(fMet)-specific endonuclease VapC
MLFVTMTYERHVKIFKNGRNQAVRIPREFELLGALEVLPFEAPADSEYGVCRASLERAGQPIGGNDLLIAAHALALGCAIVTDNEREFAPIDHLTRENWLRLTE